MASWFNLCPLLTFLPLLLRADKTNFGIFENFVVSKKVFGDELRLRDRLHSTREALLDHRDRMKGNEALETVLDGVKDWTKFSSVLVKELEAQTAEFGGIDSLKRALRGLLMLKETYNLSVEDLLSGRLRMRSPAADEGGVSERDFSSCHSLTVHDLVDLAGTAVMDGWIDDAVELTRAGVRLIEKGDLLGDSSPVPPHRREHLSQLLSMKGFLPRVQNELLEKRKALVGPEFKILPYMIGEDLERAKKQPDYLKQVVSKHLQPEDMRRNTTDRLQYRFRSVCRREPRVMDADSSYSGPPPKCSYLHHNNPLLRLAPFKMEVLLESPFRMLIRDFLSEEEMSWIKGYSQPRLSRERVIFAQNKLVKKNSRDQEKDVRRYIQKAVQVWLKDKVYNEEARYEEDQDGTITPLHDFKRDMEEGQVVNPLLRRLGRKMEAATRMKVLSRFSATMFQVTNYGLGGFCERHHDPNGLLEGAHIVWNQRHVYSSGDFILTFMGWLEDVQAGGETAFDHTGYSQLVSPKRGSAAFWIDLNKSGKTDMRSSHGGCPVAVGSKWILNRWIYSYNQFRSYPCGLDEDDEFEPFRGIY